MNDFKIMDAPLGAVTELTFQPETILEPVDMIGEPIKILVSHDRTLLHLGDIYNFDATCGVDMCHGEVVLHPFPLEEEAEKRAKEYSDVEIEQLIRVTQGLKQPEYAEIVIPKLVEEGKHPYFTGRFHEPNQLRVLENIVDWICGVAPSTKIKFIEALVHPNHTGHQEVLRKKDFYLSPFKSEFAKERFTQPHPPDGYRNSRILMRFFVKHG